MTPNKLPPLPELIRRIRYWSECQDATPLMRHELGRIADDFEALRQSQSLPAGAVAVVKDLLGREMTSWCHANERDKEIARLALSTFGAKLNRELEALQADAREKGEAWPGLGRLPHGEYSIGAGPFRIGISYDADDCSVSVLQGRKVVALLSSRDATQPAQASEKGTGELDRLRSLSDAASQDWRGKKNGVIVGGPFHEYTNGSAQSQIAMFTCHVSESDVADRQQANADFALACVAYVRVALATSSQETASE